MFIGENWVVFKVLQKALRFGEAKKLRELNSKVTAVNALEDEVHALSDGKLAAKTDQFKARLGRGETLDDFLYEAYAVVREVANRTLKMRPFDVQVMGGIVLHEGKIAEMKTGEGKTLVATLPVYQNALEGKGVHVVTVNDYLAKRDTQWMGPIYHFLGLSVAVLQHEEAYLYDPDYPAKEERLQNLRPISRREAYGADITYGTNTEFGFDYLRDNMAVSLDEKVQRGHHYAIVDEVDSILIDEARTPLIISGAPEESTKLYRQFARIAPALKRGVDYGVDEKTRTVSVTEKGIARVEEILNVDNLYDHVNTQLVHHLQQALRAHDLFKKDVDYIIKDGEVIIVDEFTGRLMLGRRYSEGLHQAIEAKERVAIREESQTLATITLQNYFRMYEKLAGMTGTAATEANEFLHTYKLETVVIPTHKPMIRGDMSDVIYKMEEGKFNAVVENIVERHKRGQPVLVGTISIEKSERLSRMLQKRGIPHEVLNAKHHEREAHIIAKAGQKGAVTIATNMAGRGVDIILGDGVVEVGGLHILGTERHEARRIDNQLRGRSGRQGDPGSSQFYLSLEDDLMRLFAAERISSLMDRLRFPEDMPIEHSLVSKSIETAQRKVETQNFATRKHVLEYDDVMNKQREVIYKQRDEILAGSDIHDHVLELIDEVVEGTVETFTDRNIHPEEWDLDGLFRYASQLFPVSLSKKELDIGALTQEKLKVMFLEDARKAYERREKELGKELLRELERTVMLNVIDNRWREHLYEMDYLREGIGLRAIGQRDPLIEYKNEAFGMFQQMIEGIKEDFVRYIYHLRVAIAEPVRPRPVLVATGGGAEVSSESAERLAPAGTRPNDSPERSRRKVGRNDPCPCGSGKKYKKCCGA
jgi:preprotein translocase subunit SecA